MADELREYLESLGLREETIDTAVEKATPDWARSQLAELGGRVKSQEAELKELRPLASADKRKEALSRVGVDYDAQKPYGKKALDSIPADKLDDLEFVAQFVKEEGFEAKIESPQAPQQQPAAARIVEHAVTAGSTVPTPPSANEAFLRDLDDVPDGDKNAARQVLAKHGRLPAEQG